MLADFARVDPPGPDMPRWNTSESPRSVSISPYFARRLRPVTRAPVSRWPRSTGSARRKIGPSRLDPRDAPAIEHRSKAADGGFNFGGSGIAAIWRTAQPR